MTSQVNKSRDDAPEQNATPKKRSRTNLVQRIVTGLILLPVVMFFTFSGGAIFAFFVALVVFLATIEFFHMEKGRESQGNILLGMPAAMLVLLSFYLQDGTIWRVTVLMLILLTFIIELLRTRELRRSLWRVGTTLAGLLYVAFPAAFLLAIRAMEPFGLSWMYAVFFATWGTDTLAYLAGRAFGRTKLAPQLSPSKTVEGAIGGIVGGIFFPSLVLLQIESLNVASFILLCISPFVAIAGDLFESGMKRYFHVKDSGVPGLNPLPGHGGVLDRIDALLWVTILFYVFLVLQGQVWIG